jgi:chaperonin GroES
MAEIANQIAIRPLGDKVLIKRLEAAEISAGGIVLPDSATEKPAEGTVKENDTVLFTSYAGTEVKWEGNEYLIMSEDDILGIVG